MQNLQSEKNNRQVSNWLMAGVIMIIVQVLIGGITRLTESGLSITEWKPITGMLPPLNDAAWQVEFEKYRSTDQFKYVHQYFSLSEFKFIFFWEWFHRVWARLLGIVFLFGFVYFLVKKKISREMVFPMVFLFLLGALQGLIGWIMVKSGLVPEKYYVGHVELTTHLIAAIALLAYTFWFAISLKPTYQVRVPGKSLRNILMVLTILFFIQLIYGGFMAGLRAAMIAPTWPDINGKFFPAVNSDDVSYVNNPLLVHFVHRGLAYILCLGVIYFAVCSTINRLPRLFKNWRTVLVAFIIFQVLLGILTVLYSTNNQAFIYLGVAHQFAAMIIVLCFTALLYLLKARKTIVADQI